MKNNEKKTIVDGSPGEAISPNRLVRWLLISAGTLSVGLGILGIFLPLLPTTPFLLLAATLYSKSSKRFYHWLMNNKWFGQYITNYREGKGIPWKVKIISVSFLWITITFSIIFVDILWVRIMLGLIAAGATFHIFRIGGKGG
jgi:hypothetical protein